MGDFNARTGTYDDCVSKDGCDHIVNDFSNNYPNIRRRFSFDNVLNSHGTQILQFCKTFDLRILNGRAKGDYFGQPTCYMRNGASVVDYIMVDQELFNLFKSFTVKPPTLLSNHSLVAASFAKPLQNVITINKINTDKQANGTSGLKPLIKQFKWSANSQENFREAHVLFYTEFKRKMIFQKRKTELSWHYLPLIRSYQN